MQCVAINMLCVLNTFSYAVYSVLYAVCCMQYAVCLGECTILKIAFVALTQSCGFFFFFFCWLRTNTLKKASVFWQAHSQMGWETCVI